MFDEAVKIAINVARTCICNLSFTLMRKLKSSQFEITGLSKAAEEGVWVLGSGIVIPLHVHPLWKENQQSGYQGLTEKEL